MTYFDTYVPAEAYPGQNHTQYQRPFNNNVSAIKREVVKTLPSKGHTQDIFSAEPFPRGFAYLNEPTVPADWTWEWVWDANWWVKLPVQ